MKSEQDAVGDTEGLLLVGNAVGSEVVGACEGVEKVGKKVGNVVTGALLGFIVGVADVGVGVGI